VKGILPPPGGGRKGGMGSAWARGPAASKRSLIAPPLRSRCHAHTRRTRTIPNRIRHVG
jgi:hypothetical protein